jgi:hypothetical protein
LKAAKAPCIFSSSAPSPPQGLRRRQRTLKFLE